jgi:hypothetical protein
MTYTTDKPALLFARADGSWIKVYCEIANTPAARDRGLMHRPALPFGTGMLFVWPRAEPVSMWMRNTPLALDIVFLGPDGRVLKIGHGSPMSTTPIPSVAQVKFVLEVPDGWCREHRIGIGDIAAFLHVPTAAV